MTLMRVMEADKVAVETGDMLCLHTGWSQAILEMGGDPTVEVLHDAYAALDGRDEKLLRWIEDSGIVGADRRQLRRRGLPATRTRTETGRYPGLPIHETCLFQLGIHLGEIWYLDRAGELAAPAHSATASC